MGPKGSSQRPSDAAREGPEAAAVGAPRLAAILNIAADAILTLDSGRRITSFNEGAAAIFGYRPEEVLGKGLDRLLPPRFRAAHDRHIEDFARSEVSARRMGERREIYGLRKSGEEFPAEASILKLRVDDEWIFAVVLRDITERKRVEEQLRRRERQLAQAQQIARVGSWEWDPATGVLECSAELYRVYGLPQGAPVSFEVYLSLLHPEDRPEANRIVREAFRTERPFHFEHRILRPGGDMRWVEGRGEIVYEDDGRVSRWVGTSQDITEQKEADLQSERLIREHAGREAAEEAARRLRFLAEASARLGSSLDHEETLRTLARLAVPTIADWCAIDLLDGEGVLRRLAVEHTDPERVRLAQELHERYPPEPDAPLGAPRVVRTGEPELGTDVDDALLRAAARDEKHLAILRELSLSSFLVVPLRAGGETLGAITLVQGESGRKYGEQDLELAEDLGRRAATAIQNARLVRQLEEATRAAEEANRAKSKFLAMMSHELRTPLNAIAGYAQLIEIGVHGPISEGQRQAIARVQHNQRHLLAIINDILDFARVEVGHLGVRPREIPVAGALENLKVLAGPEVAGKELQWRIELVDPYLTAQADPHRLEQILLNLVSNAVKFTPRGGLIAIAASAEGGRIRVRVSDTGPGFDSSNAERVFDPFVQLDGEHSNRREGLGLGLAISRELARAMGGELTVETAPGRGATFNLWLAAAGPVPGTEE